MAEAEKLTFSASLAAVLEPHLPPPPTRSPNPAPSTSPTRPFVTLTFATSLDSSLSLAPGVRTRLSGPASKAMTHHLRSRHSAILIGVSTLLADDPGLNCRLAGLSGLTGQPRPIILDPHARWTPRPSDKVLALCRAGAGLAPFVLTGVRVDQIPPEHVRLLEDHGGKYIHVVAAAAAVPGASGADVGVGVGVGADARLRFSWRDILGVLLAEEGLASVMVEGGGQVINSLLDPANHDLVDAVIVTIAPTWLGRGGVVVSPERVVDEGGTPSAAARLCSVSWLPLGEDVVLCGRLQAR
ncbi:hypothetical protein E4U43_006049 [Claviceps pusilla]|uniref:2,5-diamino-6-ribosylamino-4(3H)-pyrimidinone 5'-phosphate reductase n=1 Tax=Claviceps pusilla TaxID=123648 RepID=A0A9P7NG10_9HYPO|nr:hypothetical protein E4U43_006049 [Claviceps pusilla]